MYIETHKNSFILRLVLVQPRNLLDMTKNVHWKVKQTQNDEDIKFVVSCSRYWHFQITLFKCILGNFILFSAADL